MDELRWLLLVLAIVFIAAIYGFSRWQDARRRRPRGRAEAFADEPDIDDALRDLDAVVSDDDPVTAEENEPRLEIDRRDAPPPEPAVAAEIRESLERTVAAVRRRRRPAEPEPAPELDAAGQEKIVVINVINTEQQLVGGPELVEALESAGLRYGEQGIFQRVLDTPHGPVVLFGAANVLKPGVFDLDRLDEIASPGVAFFLQLPGPFDGLAAFERMLVASRKVADAIGGGLLDGRRCTLTNQAIEHIREELREYRRLAHLAARQAK